MSRATHPDAVVDERSRNGPRSGWGQHLAGVANDRIEFSTRERTGERRHGIAAVGDQQPLIGRIGVGDDHLPIAQLRPGASPTAGAMTVRAASRVHVASHRQHSVGGAVRAEGNLGGLARTRAACEDERDQENDANEHGG